MAILLISLGMLAVVSGFVLVRQLAHLLHQLPANNDGFTLELTETRSAHDVT